MLHASRFFGVIALAGLFAARACSEQPKPLDLIYSPWIKNCDDGTCYIGKYGRTECGQVVGVVLIEKSGMSKKTLQVTLSVPVRSERGVRIVVDQGQPITRPYACYPNGCVADYDGGPELVDQLKQGQILFLEVADAANSPISLRAPLTEFANTYDGPSNGRTVIMEVEVARNKRCDGATPPR